MKFGYFQPNHTSNANPGSHNQRDNAVTTPPPSSIPTGVRLNRFRKYPNHASATKIGAANNWPTTLHTSAPKLPNNGPPIPTQASIHALRGASLSAMNAPINVTNTGATTLSPTVLATIKSLVSLTINSDATPNAKC